MVLVNLARLHVTIEPAVDGLEGDAKFLGELGLTEPVFEPVGIELVDQVFRRGRSGYQERGGVRWQAHPMLLTERIPDPHSPS